MASNGIDAKLEKLQQRIIDEKSRYIGAVRLAVEDLLSAYGLTFLDLALEAEPVKRAKVVKGAAKVAKPIPGNGKGHKPPKYRDPETGQTWSGMGHTPGWLKGVKNRDQFLIDKASHG